MMFLLPDISRYWSLIAEVSESPGEPVDLNHIVDEVRKAWRSQI